VLCLQTSLSELQNRATREFGRAAAESTFFMHALSLPVLALFLTASPAAAAGGLFSLAGVRERLAAWAASPPAAQELARMAAEGAGEGLGLGALAARATAALLAALGLGATPVLVLFVALNVATQFVCIVGVYELLAVCDPLTVNVLLTVRKAASVVFSVVIFGNTFTAFHVAGAALVFGASLAFMADGARAGAAGAKAAAAPPAAAAAAIDDEEQRAAVVDPLRRPSAAAEGASSSSSSEAELTPPGATAKGRRRIVVK